MSFLDKLERRFGNWAIHNVTIYIIVGQIVAWGLSLVNQNLLYKMLFVPGLVLQGEVWRAFSFPFYPPAAHPLFLIFAWYLFYMMGGALEAQWGAFKYNAYLLLGAVLIMGSSFLFPSIPVTNSIWAQSVFLAFAFLFPNFEILLFFVLPVKIKWLGYIAGFFILFTILTGPIYAKVAAFFGVANFLIFFTKDIVDHFKYKQRRASAIAQKKVEALTPFHTCSQCGATDISNPERDFRYREDEAVCSACINGD